MRLGSGRQHSLPLSAILLLFLLDLSLATKCYVCGGKSVSADQCVDDYFVDTKEKDIMDCEADFLGHTEGCMKSKYVDTSGMQIVTRNCAPEIGMTASNECKTTEVAGNKVFFCHCLNDHCNGSLKTSSNISLIVTVMTVILARTSAI